MEDVLDSIRKTIFRWVNTSSPLSVNVSAGSTQLTVNNTYRFQKGDQVMIKDPFIYETGLVVDSIISSTVIQLTSRILNNWTVDQNATLIKTINEQFVQGIYVGDPDVIPRYPAITVNGTNRSSEWMTIESTKERYEVEISIYVKESTHEDGYRFLMNLTKIIQLGLKRNIIPLINDYDIISLYSDINVNDIIIKLNDRDTLGNYRRIIIEDEYNVQENWIDNIYTEDDVSVHLKNKICCNFAMADTSIVIPHRFIYNSWPAEIEYGKIHKGELMKAAVIKWFGEEEEMQFFRRNETLLN